METGLLVPRASVFFFRWIREEQFYTTVGYAVVLPQQLNGFGQQKGVPEEPRIISRAEFLAMDDFLIPHRRLIEDCNVFPVFY